jgi:mRNA interferase RelE/StbE
MALTQKNWTIEFDSAAQREFKRLDKSVALRISKFLHQRVASLENPRLIGEGLHGTLSDYWKYRVGDYRIIAQWKTRSSSLSSFASAIVAKSTNASAIQAQDLSV